MSLFIDPTYDDMLFYLGRLPILSNRKEKDEAIYFFCRMCQKEKEGNTLMLNVTRALNRLQHVPPAELVAPTSITAQHLLYQLINHYKVYSA